MESRKPPPMEQRFRSLFGLPSDFFDSCRLLSCYSQFPSVALSQSPSNEKHKEEEEEAAAKEKEREEKKANPRWSCNTCKDEFDSLQDQRSHFKSDLHRFNVKLSVAGKGIIEEEEFNVLTTESFKDYDVSSISGSEDEAEKGSGPSKDALVKAQEGMKRKLFIRLKTGDIVSVWKCLLFDESDGSSVDNSKLMSQDEEFIERLKRLICEPRDKTHLRIMLLASGGHFAGCVFDGNAILAHKTFHRYVVRAKAGKKQSAKDATGKAANSAGASLRRHNELALKKEIQELFAAWKHYFDASSYVFIHAPSNNRQLFFDGEKAHFSNHSRIVRHVPFTVRRPTLNEARRIYNLLTNMIYEVDEKGHTSSVEADSLTIESDAGQNHQELNNRTFNDKLECKEEPEVHLGPKSSADLCVSSESEGNGTSLCTHEHTPLHEAASCGDAQRTLELLEQGLDPCIKDARGRTPYMLATEKEVRNTFRRFMALNLDKWDWHVANVPSPLTKEMEESQAGKQAEKDAKKKAKSKELKKLRRAKEKAQAQAAVAQTSVATPQGLRLAQASVPKGQPHSTNTTYMNKEEELRATQAAEREKRAAAAEKRIAALNAAATNAPTSSTVSVDRKIEGSDLKCSCCMASLAGKVPFHRYHYKYCSTSCMHVHREMLEDDG
ncbi:hypothetical protein MRB53_025606 [Persea americana]|uniref:Uncharacterized protein n=1 Tax=Persea americana TaxID=3435 RepID=A0ACC2LG86_PERAE|nr:hypothetical protein MRB53_025606 [Persea americana]